MNCPKCGSPVSKNDEYCGSCGHRLTDNKGVSGGQGPHKKKKKSGILIFAVILEIVAIAFIVVMVLRGFPDKKAEDDKPVVNHSGEEAESENGTSEDEPASETETSKTEPAEESDEETSEAEPAPGSNVQVAEEEPAPENPQESETHLIDNTDTLKEVKASYKKIGKDQITDSYASSTIDQDMVDNKPIFLFDGDDTTNWQEGVSGSGIGEYLNFVFDKTYSVEYMTFKLGNWKTEEYFNENYRPKTLLINSGNNSWTITFADVKQEFLVQLDPATDMNNIKITIQDVYSDHMQWEDTPITDIGLWYK